VVNATPELIARGEHIADTFCAGCHSMTGELPLSGGRDLGKDSAVNVGSFVAVNLTPGGRLKDWTDGEIFQAVRNGIDKDGRVLALMSTTRGRNLSDVDLKAGSLIAQPAGVTNESQTRWMSQPRCHHGAGLLPGGKPPFEW
jgi:mono/diheme cytochrome c family protein